MQPTSSSPAAATRLERLVGYLELDPDNATLLAETCDLALQARDDGVASRCLAAAERLQLDPVPWGYRRALAALLAGHAATSRAGAAALLERAHDNETLGHVQALWLRGSHHAGALEEAWVWVLAQRVAGRLQPVAQGVAALLAVDVDQLDDARELADASLAARAAPVEALVARAYAALADDDAALAAQLLEHALARGPDDGRTWSVLGMVSLREGAFGTARERLQRATRSIPQHVGTWHALGWTCLLQQDVPGARAAFAQALALDRNFAESQAAMALVFTLEGQDGPAREHLERAERLDRNAATVRYVRALRAGQLPDAQRLRAFATQLWHRSRERLHQRSERPEP